MNNEVTNFMYYMYNEWSQKEAVKVFGKDLGEHVWDKWVASNTSHFDATLYWYAELDSGCKQKIVDRANEIYSKCFTSTT